jgi:hypothetical protein
LAARKAITTRHHPDADTSDLDRDLAAAALEEHIRKIVDSAPPLSPDQRTRLALLLAPATDGGGQDAA